MHEATVFEMAPATINSRKSREDFVVIKTRADNHTRIRHIMLHHFEKGWKAVQSFRDLNELVVGTTLRTPPITCGCDLLRNMVVLSLRLCSGRSSSDDAFVEPGGSTTRGGVKKAVELCNRVLTTSRGHVTTAPTVPAVLQTNKKEN
uniref:Uncharacterized protein n=1 Tax=Glossina austeni TaxID=7395 RepID=A0A1A9VXM1_GLOAU